MSSLETILYIFSALVTLMIILYIVLYYINTTPSGVTSTNKEVVTMDGSKAGELTLFFAKWCPACKSIKPEWDQFRNDYSNKKINGTILLIREVDCSEPNPETEDVMNQYNITGFPTVKLTYNGKIIELQQKPTYDNLVKFVNSSL
jgi:thiol-disulfide isomerase/thioredoxin